jgi:hypothetical protein
MRQRLFDTSLTDLAGSFVRITVKSAAASQLKIAKMYIGPSAGTASFTSTPTQVTFDGGSASVLIASGGNLKVSDAIAFPYDGLSELVISTYHDATAGFLGSTSITNSRIVSKAGDDAATLTASGYSSGTINDVIYQLEAD